MLENRLSWVFPSFCVSSVRQFSSHSSFFHSRVRSYPSASSYEKRTERKKKQNRNEHSLATILDTRSQRIRFKFYVSGAAIWTVYKINVGFFQPMSIRTTDGIFFKLILLGYAEVKTFSKTYADKTINYFIYAIQSIVNVTQTQPNGVDMSWLLRTTMRFALIFKLSQTLRKQRCKPKQCECECVAAQSSAKTFIRRSRVRDSTGNSLQFFFI